MTIGSYGKKRKKSSERRCREDGKHTLMFDFQTEHETVWECEFCGMVFKFSKRP